MHLGPQARDAELRAGHAWRRIRTCARARWRTRGGGDDTPRTRRFDCLPVHLDASIFTSPRVHLSRTEWLCLDDKPGVSIFSTSSVEHLLAPVWSKPLHLLAPVWWHGLAPRDSQQPTDRSSRGRQSSTRVPVFSFGTGAVAAVVLVVLCSAHDAGTQSDPNY